MGSIIYRDFDREALDREYNARASVPDVSLYLKAYAEMSAAARDVLPCMCDISYGDHPAMTLDYFPAGPGTPLFIYIHGGYWRALSSKDSAFMAPNLTTSGISVAALNYALVPEAALDEIIYQCRAAAAFCAELAPELGIDPSRIYVGGSSAGGHLAAMTAAKGWQTEMGAAENIVKGFLSTSGLMDLEPVRLSHVNEWMQLDAHAVRRCSPVNHLPLAGTRIVTGAGGAESSEFKRQSADYAALCRAAGHDVREIEPAGRNHFDVIMELCKPDSELTTALLHMVNGKTD